MRLVRGLSNECYSRREARHPQNVLEVVRMLDRAAGHYTVAPMEPDISWRFSSHESAGPAVLEPTCIPDPVDHLSEGPLRVSPRSHRTWQQRGRAPIRTRLLTGPDESCPPPAHNPRGYRSASRNRRSPAVLSIGHRSWPGRTEHYCSGSSSPQAGPGRGPAGKMRQTTALDQGLVADDVPWSVWEITRQPTAQRGSGTRNTNQQPSPQHLSLPDWRVGIPLPKQTPEAGLRVGQTVLRWPDCRTSDMDFRAPLSRGAGIHRMSTSCRNVDVRPAPSRGMMALACQSHRPCSSAAGPTRARNSSPVSQRTSQSPTSPSRPGSAMRAKVPDKCSAVAAPNRDAAMRRNSARS